MEGGTRERFSTASSLDNFIITAIPLKINTARAKTMTTFKKDFPDMVDYGKRLFNVCLSERLMRFYRAKMYVLAKG